MDKINNKKTLDSYSWEIKKKCKCCGVKLNYIAANYKHENYNGKKNPSSLCFKIWCKNWTFNKHKIENVKYMYIYNI